MKEDKVREMAQRAADVEFGDFGLFSGNVAESISEFVYKLKGVDRLLFTELFLAEVRLRLLSPEFDTDTRYETRHHHFNPRS